MVVRIHTSGQKIMNELETIVHEVHDHLINNKDLSSDITIKVLTSSQQIILKYFDFSIVLHNVLFELQYKHYCRYENYVPDIDCHFEESILHNVLCNVQTMKKMIEIREYYEFSTMKSEVFMTNYNFVE